MASFPHPLRETRYSLLGTFPAHHCLPLSYATSGPLNFLRAELTSIALIGKSAPNCWDPIYKWTIGIYYCYVLEITTHMLEFQFSNVLLLQIIFLHSSHIHCLLMFWEVSLLLLTILPREIFLKSMTPSCVSMISSFFSDSINIMNILATITCSGFFALHKMTLPT